MALISPTGLDTTNQVTTGHDRTRQAERMQNLHWTGRLSTYCDITNFVNSCRAVTEWNETGRDLL